MDTEKLRLNYELFKTSTFWNSNGKCKGYAISNPGEAAKVDQYIYGLVAGDNPTAPNLATAFGKGLVGMIESMREPVVVPPPPPPPPSTGYTVDAPQEPFTLVDGLNSSDSGYFSYSTGAEEYSHRDVRNFCKYGVGFMAWPPKDSTADKNFHDVKIKHIVALSPGQFDGTAEAGLWVGQRGHYYRFTVEDAYWMALWTGARCKGSLVEDFEISSPRVAAYLEHCTENFVMRDGILHAGRNGINIEWWYQDATYAPFMPAGCLAGKAGSHDIELYNLTIYAGDWGIFIDAGNYNINIHDCKIIAPNGIAYPANLANPNGKGGDVTIDWGSIDMTQVTGTKRWKHTNAIG